ncbi:MAG TPA: MlaD family protein [Solirubrobacteraceae bacterium]|nr:MlaD family protein [Solirubrobacteraceae bacterium]
MINAYFTSARGLVAGDDVRINGAPAGSVTSLKLAGNDQALVTMQLATDIPYRPRADATAAIRPANLLGDDYVAITLGSRSAAPLRGAIPAARTLDAPQLSDLLSAFREPERAGLQALLIGLGVSLDDRGADLNQAALALRPALEAADSVVSELGSQNADLQRVIVDADQITEQAAAHDGALGRSVTGLRQLVDETARHLPGLAGGLATFPQTLRELTTTAGELRNTAVQAAPLAAALQRTAAPLSTTVQRLPDFLSALGSAAGRLHPTLNSATSLLVKGDPSIYALGSGLRALNLVGGDLSRFGAALVPAAPAISQGFFVNFPDQASEPGTQPFDPFANPLRHYWRGAAVFSCESFGLPIAPGCLTKFLARGSSPAGRRSAAPARTRRLPRVKSAPATPTGAPAGAPSAQGHPVAKIISRVVAAAAGPGSATGQASATVTQLLGYLLRR